jgi:outer membrane protein OmpA-like peptidoglycan-associated protein
MAANATEQGKIKIQSKRNVELWIYSFADMYMILSIFFIALSVIYAAKVTKAANNAIASAGRGPSAVTSEVQIDFPEGSATPEEASLQYLELLLPAFQKVEKGYVEVEGYADAAALKRDSPFRTNLHLSSERAVHVSEWLIKKGVPSSKIRVVAMGNGRTWKKSEVGSNRRVVLKIVSTETSQ